MPSLAEAITAMIAKAVPAPNIRLGVVATVAAPLPASGDPYVVTVSGLAEENIACDWAAGFDLEIGAQGQALVGRPVEVHLIDGQPVIAYSIVIGGKS